MSEFSRNPFETWQLNPVKKQPTNTRPKNAISLHPLTPAQALSAALRVNPAELKALEEKARSEKKRKK